MEYPAENTIPTERCWALLRQGWFGRLGLSVDALPAILPVEYSVAEGDIAVCLGQYRLNARSVNESVVAFAADLVDSETRSGWTVQVQGRARLPKRAVTTECGLHEPGQIIYITPQTVVGQSLRLCPLGTGLPRLRSI
ncbi:MAG TPA: pyridoxamine 5'-phosphate oxidase family protein [Acidimicrobiia bacterium]